MNKETANVIVLVVFLFAFGFSLWAHTLFEHTHEGDVPAHTHE